MRWAPKGTLRNRSASTSCWRRWSASADPEGERTRRAAPRLGGFFPATHRRGERQVLRSNLLRLEGAHVLRHARERFGDRHGRPGTLLRRDPANRIAPRDHDRAEIRALHPQLLT